MQILDSCKRNENKYFDGLVPSQQIGFVIKSPTKSFSTLLLNTTSDLSPRQESTSHSSKPYYMEGNFHGVLIFVIFIVRSPVTKISIHES